MKRGILIATALFLLPLSAQAEVKQEEVTLRDLGRAVHYLIELYRENSRKIEELREENERLRAKVKELEKKLVLIRLAQKVGAGENSKIRTGYRKVKERKKEPFSVEIVPGNQPNRFPWITFKRSDVECSLPERTERGYRYLNVLVTTSREKAENLARNVARTGICSVVRVIRRNPPLYRVVVIPPEGKEKEVKEKLKAMGLKYYPYIRNLDLTKSSGGQL